MRALFYIFSCSLICYSLNTNTTKPSVMRILMSWMRYMIMWLLPESCTYKSLLPTILTPLTLAKKRRNQGYLRRMINLIKTWLKYLNACLVSVNFSMQQEHWIKKIFLIQVPQILSISWLQINARIHTISFLCSLIGSFRNCL